MKDILNGKEMLKKKQDEKAEREGKKNIVQFKIEEEKKEEAPMTLAAKKTSTMNRKAMEDKLNTSNFSMMSEAQKEREKQKQEIEEWGVSIIKINLAFRGCGSGKDTSTQIQWKGGSQQLKN